MKTRVDLGAWHSAECATWICGAYDEEVVAADADLSAPADFQHAQDQLALAKQYPEHARSLPSARVH